MNAVMDNTMIPALLRFAACSPLLLATAALAGRSFQFSAVGCFVDFTNQIRDMNGLVYLSQLGSSAINTDPSFAGFFASSSMTQELCASLCTMGGFLYFGVQNWQECYCGNTYGSQGAANPSDCSHTCVGNTAQKCGGPSRNSVFAIAYTYPNLFVSSDRVNVTALAAYTKPTYSEMRLPRGLLMECTLGCLVQGSDCQAVIFPQQPAVTSCYLLRFAAVPGALVNTAGEFYVRG